MKKIIETIKQKWVEYLLELIVIIVGILGAYALNSWNEQLKNRHLETDYLNEINEEFIKNKEQLDFVLAIRRDICDACDKVKSMAPLSVEDWDSIYFYYQQAIYMAPRFDPSTNSIESLINNASFDIIKSDSLKSLLINFDNIYNDWNEEESDAIRQVFILRDWIAENVNTQWTARRSTIINTEEIYVLQNLMRSRCGYAYYLLNGDQYTGRNETELLQEAIDGIIESSQSKE